ncbi:class I SAM-dependent methyltransferase [Candidatus Woesearchaeota archaeon]|nr:class I SAM-dependent methyltransferase [Candidatus Woesearchaeota archaeon]
MADICISCNSNKNIKPFKNNSFLGYPVYFCSKCSLYFFYSRDKEIEKKCNEYYASEYWSTVRKKWDESRKSLNLIIKVLRFLKTQPLQQLWHYRMIKKYVPAKKSGKFLDIGCGKGEFLVFFSNKGYDAYGIEPDKDNARKINKLFGKNICVNGIIEKVELNKKFDVVYLCHVFEHLIRPDKFIEKIKKNLSPNGIIFLEVPNCENRKILQNSVEHHPHIYCFTHQSLKKLFEKHNYKVLKIGIYSEIRKNHLLMFFLMLLGLNNYKMAPKEKGERIIVIAKKRT